MSGEIVLRVGPGKPARATIVGDPFALAEWLRTPSGLGDEVAEALRTAVEEALRAEADRIVEEVSG